jgi:hypothetical protein
VPTRASTDRDVACTRFAANGACAIRENHDVARALLPSVASDMRRHLCIDTVRVTLMTALGLLSGCGGTTDANPGGDGASPEVSESGATETGIPEGGTPDQSSAPEPEGGDGPTNACRYTCVNPMPVLVGGVDTGYDSCGGGYMRRRAQISCPSLLPRTGNGACSQPFDASPAGCSSDSDCASDPYGHCELTAPDAGIPVTCECVHGCKVDSDCGGNEVCVCADPIGHCAPATCTTSASCAAAGCDCIASSMGSSCGPQFDCQTPRDQCAAPDDCMRQDAGFECSENAGVHSCGPYSYCGVGRPFLVAGAARLAPTTVRTDWSARGLEPDLADLTLSERQRLGDHWLRVAQMEHASIAAFARFTLHLLALGAPSELVVGSNRAMLDETEHARFAFALASAFLGREVGPGILPIEGALDSADLGAFLATLLREGCIGETRAAVEAREMLDATRDPAVREVLETIATDETRHAALAWRTLEWLLASGRVHGSRVRAELDMALREMEPRDGDIASRLVRPCADALLAFGA